MIRKVRIGSTLYNVRYVRNLRNEKDEILRGRIFYGDDVIQINKDFPVSVQRRTLYHESTHGITEEYELNDYEEKEIAILSKGFFAFIINNPEYIREILRYAKKMGEK